MRTSDIFVTTALKLNESIEKVFGKKINLESFDLEQLQDARNKLRTQVSQVRSESSFNETVENDAFTQAQWMLDAINAEISERAEYTVQEAPSDTYEMEYMFTGDDGETGDGTITYEVVNGQVDPNSLRGYCQGDGNNKLDDDWCTEMVQPGGYEHEEALAYAQEDYAEQVGSQGNEGFEAESDMHADPDPSEYDREGEMSKGQLSTGEEAAEELRSILAADEDLPEWVQAKITLAVDYLDTARDYMKGQHEKGVEPTEDINTNEAYINNAKDAVDLLANLRKQSKMAELGQGDPVRPNQLVNDLWDVMQWIEHNMKESIGESMRNLREGEIQQASAIVTAKTMVDRVGRWIEELSGMENDTLLTLGDSIRDEMGAEQAKQFISACAPAIQSALENLKATREALSTSVRALTGEEQGVEMLGGEPAGEVPADDGMDDLAGPADPDAMNPDLEMGADDEFATAEPATGGAETAGREKRESIDRQNSLLRVLAG